jgi:hypothetical protein
MFTNALRSRISRRRNGLRARDGFDAALTRLAQDQP